MKRLTLHRSQSFRGPLILVNRDHPLQEVETPELIPLDAAYPDIRMERRAGKLLSACIQAAGGRGTIVPVSGWRSFREQQAIWDDTWAKEGEAFTRQYVAFPGCSEHQTGLAMDLAKAAPSIDFIRPDFPDEGPCGTFRRLAARYGFMTSSAPTFPTKGPAGPSAVWPPNTASFSATAGRRRRSPTSPRSPGTSGMWGCPTPCSWRRTACAWRSTSPSCKVV